jgi:hypothetical protein
MLNALDFFSYDNQEKHSSMAVINHNFDVRKTCMK